MISRTLSGSIQGVDVQTVEIEVQVFKRRPSEQSQECHFNLIGLPDAAIRESRDRIRSALGMNRIGFPLGNITVNLAPANLRKSGALYDLPIALCISVFNGQVRGEFLHETLVVGELALTGEVRPVRGVLPMAMHAKSLGIHRMIVPFENALEAAVVSGVSVYGVKTIAEALRILEEPSSARPSSVDMEALFRDAVRSRLDFRDVKGQSSAKRALLIAAAGSHNVLLVGQPGVGKSLIANRIPGIMPPLDMEESMEVTRIYSIAGLLGGSGLIVDRPFRSPHHTVSDAGLMGGGSGIPRPGEITLAHRGVLFLDELPEFRRSTLEALRQPMENGFVTIARASGSFLFPSRFMLVAAMNPCPCGYYGSPDHKCTCTFAQVNSYRGRVSGPLLDRIDVHLEVPPLPKDVLMNAHDGPSSEELRQEVLEARARQLHRYRGTNIRDNSSVAGAALDRFCALSEAGRAFMKSALEAKHLSARSYDRILRVARTCADLNGHDAIQEDDLAEACQYRSMDQRIAWQERTPGTLL